MEFRRVHLRTIALVTTLMSSILACANVVGPDRSPDVLVPAGGAAANDSSANAKLDTLTPGRLRGIVIVTAADSTSTWSAIAGVSVDVAKQDPVTGAMIVLATTTTDAAGIFMFDRIDTPAGLLFVHATPAGTSSYRASQWLAGYAFTGPWIRTGIVSHAVSIGPYVALERTSAPPRQFAPILVLGHVWREDGYTGIPGAAVMIDRVVPPNPADSIMHHPLVSLGTVASARTDASGFFVIELPSTGTFASRVTMPVGSPYAGFPLMNAFPMTANPDAAVISYQGFTSALQR